MGKKIKQIEYLIIVLFLSLKSFSQNKIHLNFYKANVFENIKKHSFKIKLDKQILYDNLKFVQYAEGTLQVLNDKNELFYLNKELKKIIYPEKNEEIYCGTVNDFFVKIKENKKYYLIEKTIKPIDSRQEIKTVIIDSFSKKGIKDIYFLNKKKNIQYDENFFFPETLIVETKKGKKRIRSEGKTSGILKEIDFTNPLAIKAKKDQLWGYYNITAFKYKKLSNFFLI